MIDGYYPSDPIEYLRMELQLRQRRNTSYSIRAFARDLDLSPSHLSEFLSGKASLSVRRANDLSERLRLSREQKEHWIDLLNLKDKSPENRKIAKVRIQKRNREDKSQVSVDSFEVIADWQHFAILAFFGVNPAWTFPELSSKLGIPQAEVKNAIKKLERLDLLESFEGGHRPKSNSSFAGDSIPSEAIRESHRQILGRTIEALDIFDMNERLSQSFFFSVPEKNVKALRTALQKRILETVSEFADENNTSPTDPVQTLTWHLYPVDAQAAAKNMETKK